MHAQALRQGIATQIKNMLYNCKLLLEQEEEEEEEEFYIHIPGPMWAYWMEYSTSTLS